MTARQVGRRVVVVDDEPAILLSTAALLADLGFDVRTCADVHRIVETVRAHAADVVLQDVRMPGLDLEHVVRSLRSVRPDLPIVLFTASMDAEEIADRLQVSVVLEKPFRPDQLLDAMAQASAAST